MFLFFPALLCASSAVSGDQTPYYARFEVKTHNKAVVETSFLMEPASEEFRTEKFELKKIAGKSPYNSKVDIISAAKHDALSRVLTRHGLKSIKTRSVVQDGIPFEEIIITYEGVFRHPFTTLNKGYTTDQHTCTIEMSVWFSPIAFPDRWSFLYMRHLLRRALCKASSVFKNSDF